MAKAPGAAADFDGSGQVWFKIKDIGPDFSSGQAVWDMSRKFSTIIRPNIHHITNPHKKHTLITSPPRCLAVTTFYVCSN